MPIRVLPVHLVNKIAAGEVIERPASVVKELVENAIDAGATRIDVAVEDGGRKLIAVTDNGGGMTADDVAMAFLPHATSKIAAEEDLSRIETMGFRGEALASIASISHAHIRSRRRADDQADQSGYEIEASGETLSEVKPCPAAPGTTVTIRDLFFNTPARRKFMRTVNTELGQVSEQVTRLALPHPQVDFRLTHNGREIMKLPAAGSTLHRVCDLFGAELADSLLILSGAGPVAGLISKPSVGRATAQWQYIFLNGRYIRDRSLAHAIREAYRGLTDPNRCPMAFVFLSIDPADVDVNVHPTKIEVRFRDGHAVYGALLGALKDTLNRANLSPSASLDRSGGIGPQSHGAGLQDAVAGPEASGGAAGAGLDAAEGMPQKDDQRRQSLRQALADFFRSIPPPQPHLAFGESTPQHRRPAPAAEPPPVPGGLYHQGVDTAPSGADSQPGSGADPSGVGAVGAEALPLPVAIQIHNSYIVAQGDEGVLIIDQHALHERLLYNDLRRRLAEGPLAGQRLLIPQVVNTSPAAAQMLLDRADLLARLGIEVAAFGPSSLAVQQFPSLLTARGVAPDDFLREVIDTLQDNESAQPENLLEKLLSVLACKAAVKAGDPLSPAEIQSLLQRRQDADKASSCPHGRPTTLTISFKDLEKQFKRT